MNICYLSAIIATYVLNSVDCFNLFDRIFGSKSAATGSGSSVTVIKNIFTNGICDKGCFINLQDNPVKYPLFLTTNNKFYEVKSKDREPGLSLCKDDSIKLACTGTNNYFEKSATKQSVANIKCIENQKFQNENGVNYDIKHWMCKKTSDSMIRTITNENDCGKGLQSYEAGFSLSKSEFIRLYTMCRNDRIQRTTFSKFHLAAGVDVMNAKRFDFRGEDEKMYTGSLNQLLKIRNLHKKYVFGRPQNILARGHLVANANFNFASQNKATFFYKNAAPQWQIFNARNWKKVENKVREFPSNSEIYVGVYGQMSLELKDHSKLPLYLDMTKKILPVPELFWIYVKEPNQRKVFIVGINDPFLNEEDYKKIAKSFCSKTECSEIDWTGSSQIFCCKPTNGLLQKVGINTTPSSGIFGMNFWIF